MESTPGDNEILPFRQAKQAGDQPCIEELAGWMLEQLEGALARLVRSVNTLIYTRNPVAMAVTAQQCDRVEQLLDELQSLYTSRQEAGGQAAAAANFQQSIQSLLFAEAEGLLAEARRLVAVPLKPLHRSDNVVVLKPDYADLADAAFERMLACSDIPELLAEDTDACDSWDEQLDFNSESRSAKPAVALKLVYSSDAPQAR
ncbi:MAG: hypothetical protein KJO62_06010 [Gammaproteobacteria bacterium]|nr:hypothetical protein [Gammaproteobacteria bacterium]NND39456.1 hypothetical protein [Pseudomonadales bacterium]NNM11928.1 hypothetical protein [Pseudomonadales bacterium]